MAHQDLIGRAAHPSKVDSLGSDSFCSLLNLRVSDDPDQDLRKQGFVAMDNHVHLAAIPERESCLAIGIGRMHHDFARWQNVQRNQNGHLWQNRFFSCPVEEDRVWSMLAYIELNPVRAGMVVNAWDWAWSSAQAHVTGSDPTGLLNMGFWRRQFTAEGWKRYLEGMAAEKAMNARIRSATATGRLLGSDATARRLEQELGRPLLPRRRGRKSRRSKSNRKLEI
jgi:putative transposase